MTQWRSAIGICHKPTKAHTPASRDPRTWVRLHTVNAMSFPENSHPSPTLSRTTDDDPPIAKPWWFHSSPLSLDDPLAPLPKSALEEGTWKPFSKVDCQTLEEKYENLPELIKRKDEYIPNKTDVVDELAFKTRDDTGVDKQVDDVSRDNAKVIVGIEQLHHVDLVTQRLSRPRMKD